MNVKVNNSALEYKAPPAASQSVVTVSSSATTLAGLSVVIPAGLQYVMLQVQAQPIRATFDGTTPTATVGQSLPALSNLAISVSLASAMKVIREGASDATLWVQPIGV